MMQKQPPKSVTSKSQAVSWARTILARKAIILDFETTGGGRGAEIVQVGAIDTDGNVLMDTLVKPQHSIPQQVIDIHGITDAMVAESPGFAAIYVKLSVLLAGKIVVAYNAAFEENILTGECGRYGLPMPRLQQWSCAMKAYASYWGQWNPRRRSFAWQKLGNACQQQEIIVENAHNAIGDCRMTLALIYKMAEYTH